MNSIFKRRSIRKFSDKSVDESIIKELLTAGMSAPSAGNCQPWHFIVIDDKQKLQDIASFHPYAKMVAQSPIAILVCAEPAREKHVGFWPQDCAAATQNILLYATEKGLGNVWVGIHPKEDMKKEFVERFDIPEGIIPFGLIPIGYAAEEKQPNQRYLEERIHKNNWGK